MKKTTSHPAPMRAPTLSVLVIASLLLAPAVAAGPDPGPIPERCAGVEPGSDFGVEACVDTRDACLVRVAYTDKTGTETTCVPAP